ncbi:hypothetical protein D3C76_187260 [compost metagenome]
MKITSEIIKIGICSTADFASGTITATFPDRQDIVTQDIPVVLAGGGLKNSLPKVGDTVVCLMLGNSLSNGICIGVIPDSIPGAITQEGVYFEDGSCAYYDTSSQQLVIKAASGVKIDGDLTVTGNVMGANIGGG